MSGNIVAIPIAGDHESRTKITACVYINTDHISSITVDMVVGGGMMFIYTTGKPGPIEIESNWLPAGWDFDQVLCALEWNVMPTHSPAYYEARARAAAAFPAPTKTRKRKKA